MRITLKDNNTLIPRKGHEDDAGWDLYSPIDFIIEGHEFSHRVCLDVAFEIPKGYVGRIEERSSQGKVGLHTLGNVVDHKYTGFVHVTLMNNQDTPVQIKRGDRICQLVVYACLNEPLEVVESLDETERGNNAHGSTGK